MAFRNPAGSLTTHERRIVKALLEDGWRNQDIQALLNIGRKATINSARITEVKQDDTINPASDKALDFFIAKKAAYDPKTGLNLYDDERLIRAREAMMLAVQVFNSPSLSFKTEVFAILANVAWTYLLHEFYARKGVRIVGRDGRSLLLSQMTKRRDCPLTDGVVRNINALKEIRDEVEHSLLGRSDFQWLALFQACCLNFENNLCRLFGEQLSLQKELAFALQFAKLDIEQLSEVEKHHLPQRIQALDARLRKGLTEEQLQDIEYQFRVIYTLDSASKSQSHIHFIHPESDEAEKIRNVLVKYKTADELYPHKPNMVTRLVADRSGMKFTNRNHVQAWRKYKARPRNGASQPANTKKDYCIYHAAHRDYTYSEKWVEFLVEQVSTEEGLAEIRSFQM